jgi:NADH-quinone oxidoreductase subunit J
MRSYAEQGTQLGPLPAPGVFARHNAVDTPALLPDGTPSEISVSRTLAARGSVRTVPRVAIEGDPVATDQDSPGSHHRDEEQK